jgi:hypothetical protein
LLKWDKVWGRREHPEQTAKNGNPARESYHHGPITSPKMVDTDDRKASNEQKYSVAVDEKSAIGFPDTILSVKWT